jgi:hypothetical protein
MKSKAVRKGTARLPNAGLYFFFESADDPVEG